jgi:hypothetical protein
MKLAILSESPADEAALGVLIEAVLGGPYLRVQANLRARGWPSVAQVLPAVIRHLHFNTDAEGLVVVVDSDDSVVHTPSARQAGLLSSAMPDVPAPRRVSPEHQESARRAGARPGAARSRCRRSRGGRVVPQRYRRCRDGGGVDRGPDHGTSPLQPGPIEGPGLRHGPAQPRS